MVVLPLRLPLNTALHRAKQKGKPVQYQGIKLEYQGELLNLCLEVIPPYANRQHGDFFLVKIKPEVAVDPSEIPQTETFELGSEASRRIIELENELQQTRENLQALVEELETTNEEQQASNEELTASNEELQSTNEELYSVNEELHTVNIEYQSKIGELTQLNNDIDNLLKSTEIGVIFLDSQLRIRKFTPAATQAISLRETDIERPLAELTMKVDCPQLPELLEAVLEHHQSVELEVKQHKSDSWFLMQINPYLTEDGQNEGLAVSFVAINEIKQVQLDLENSLDEKDRQLAAIKTATNGIAILNQDKFIYINQAHLDIFGYGHPEELLGKYFLFKLPKIFWLIKYLPRFPE
ncbi:MAG: PAS domain-containing protein, partial [Cyanobacteria bacterium P01_E01_bin.35]